MKSRSLVVPAELFDSRQYGFAQVAVVSTPLGRAVHVSGQVAWDADQNIVGPGDVGRQLEKSLDNLAAALASVGIRQSHIGEGKAISAALRAKFGDNPPCATWIGVTSLADEQFLIEVEPSVVFLDSGTTKTSP
jgi:enamine deaminase RidA (YjgF/YER057c/UK114 family)